MLPQFEIHKGERMNGVVSVNRINDNPLSSLLALYARHQYSFGALLLLLYL
jgi:hypothetical protein